MKKTLITILLLAVFVENLLAFGICEDIIQKAWQNEKKLRQGEEIDIQTECSSFHKEDQKLCHLIHEKIEESVFCDITQEMAFIDLCNELFMEINHNIKRAENQCIYNHEEL